MEYHSWDEQLMVAAQSFKASTERGIGPGKQSWPLPWARMTAADLDEHLAADRFPLRPGLCVVLFVFFFMRDLERATAEYADARFDEASEGCHHDDERIQERPEGLRV